MAEAAVGMKSLGTMFAAASAVRAKKKDKNPSDAPPREEEWWVGFTKR